ncbi:restriction endonuclease subunit S, partial [Candidatus Microgenomates bacterium]|nr:restriction endonuclease subunit S [Candidatus Microgenomates bacterium]
GRVGAYCGSIYFSKTKCWVTDNAITGHTKTKNSSRFLFYLLKKLDLNKQRGGSSQPLINQSILYSLKVAVPTTEEEQVAIAKVLSDLDSKIELNQQMNKTLEVIGQNLFKRWFIDFEFPNNNGKPYKSSDGKMVDSELGNIPKEWSVEPIGSITDIAIGRTPPRKESQWFSTNPSDIKWISIRDLGHVGIYIGQSAEYLTLDAVERFNVPVIPKNSVVLSFKLTVGRVAITTEDMLSNEAIAHFKLVNNSYNLSPEFIYLFLKNYDFSQLGSTSSIATAVNSQSIKKIKVILPDKKTIDDFNNLVGSIFNQLKNTYFEINSLSNIRDSLLPRLMNGKIRVKI